MKRQLELLAYSLNLLALEVCLAGLVFFARVLDEDVDALELRIRNALAEDL